MNTVPSKENSVNHIVIEHSLKFIYAMIEFCKGISVKVTVSKPKLFNADVIEFASLTGFARGLVL